MLDTTFGNVKADLTYEEMIELVRGVKPGDLVKLRDDLDCRRNTKYRVKFGGAFSDWYSKRYTLYYNTLENDYNDCSLKCKWGEEYGEYYDWIPYNMVDIDWLIAYRKEEEKAMEIIEPMKNNESMETHTPLKERIEEDVTKTEDNLLKSLEELTEDILNTEITYCAAPVNQQQDFFKMANDLNSIVELEINEAIEKLNGAIAKANAINRDVHIMLPNSTTYFGVKGAESEVDEDSNEIKIIIK